MSARHWLVAGVAGVALAGPAVVLLPRLQAAGGDEPAAAKPATTVVTVDRRTLRETSTADGTLGYGERRPVVNRLPGTVTWTPAEGAVVRRGGTLYEVDGEPVALLYGDRPAYRALGIGSEGVDVRALETNLAALGFDPGTVDDYFSGATASAVRDWQERQGRPETGRVELGDIVVLPGEVRVASVELGAGEPVTPGQPVLQATGTARVVTVELDPDLRQYVREGTPVTVTLPDASEARGTVASIGRVAKPAAGQEGQGDEDPTVTVTVRLADPRAGGALDEAPVDVAITTLERANVLAVPVSALLALAEGGYAVETEDGTLLAVKPGVHANGWVEVSGDRVAAGLRVVVPA